MARRKAEMILELIDRATRPARKFMRLQKLMGAATQKANQIAARTARFAAGATKLYTIATNGLNHAQGALRRGIASTNRFIDRQTQKLRTSAGLMKSGVMGVGTAAVVAGGLIVGYGGSVAAAAGMLTGPAAQFERFAIQLETLEGSAQKGKQAMAWIENFARSTPLELDQVVNSYAKMRSFGLDPTNGSLTALLDTMSAMGGTYEMLESMTLALGKAQTKGKLQGEEIMMLMERGIPVYDLLGEKMGKSAEQLQKMASKGRLGRKEIALLIEAMGERNAGATEKISKSWDGLISNLMDWWTKARIMIADAGVFDHMKGTIRGFLTTLETMYNNGELKKWTDNVARQILVGLNALSSFGQVTLRTWREIQPWLQYAAATLGGWRNLALLILAIPLRGVLLGAAFGLMQIAWGAGLAVTALGGIGFGSIAAGALYLGRVFLGLLNPMNWVRAAFVALRVAFIATGIGAIIAGLAMAGVWIYNNWSGLASFFTGFGQAFMAALGPAGPLVQWVIDGVSKLWGWVKKLIGPVNANAETWKSWGQSVGAVVGNVVSAVIAFPVAVVTWLKSAWTEVSSWVSDMWSSLVPYAKVAWSALSNLLLNYTPHGLIYTHWDGITGFFSGLWDGVRAIFKSKWDWIQTNVIDRMKNAISFMTDNPLTRGFGNVKSFIVGDKPETPPRPPKDTRPKAPPRGGPGARAAALSASLAASVIAAPAAATDEKQTTSPSKYVKASSNSTVSISAPLNFTINGNVDRDTLEELKAHLEERLDERDRDVADQIRRASAREHD